LWKHKKRELNYRHNNHITKKLNLCKFWGSKIKPILWQRTRFHVVKVLLYDIMLLYALWAAYPFFSEKTTIGHIKGVIYLEQRSHVLTEVSKITLSSFCLYHIEDRMPKRCDLIDHARCNQIRFINQSKLSFLASIFSFHIELYQ